MKQLSFDFDGNFTFPAPVIAERILKYHREDEKILKEAELFIEKIQKLKAEEIPQMQILCHEYLKSLQDKYYLEQICYS